MNILARINQTLSFAAYRLATHRSPVLVATAMLFTFGTGAIAFAQDGYSNYQYEEQGPNMFERLMISPGATLLMVLIGSAGVFNFFVGSSKKGANADQKQLIGLGCILLVCLMVWFRFNVWNNTYRHR